MSFEVKTIAHFEKEFKRLFKKYPSLKSDIFKLILQLELNPESGIALGKGFFKIRLSIASKGKGKSGGAPVTCVKVFQGKVYLAPIYDESEKPDITNDELKFLASQIG